MQDISATWVGIALLIFKLSSAITPMPLTATVGLKLSGKAKTTCKQVAGEIATLLTVAAAAAAVTAAAVTATMEGRVNGGGRCWQPKSMATMAQATQSTVTAAAASMAATVTAAKAHRQA